jgi:small subunit ribosomal protein S10
MQKIRVKIKGFDYKVVDKATTQICQSVVETGAKIKGPIPLPNKRWMMAVQRGPHIDADHKDHWGLTEHTRLVDVINFNPKTIETLTHMQLPAGVGIEIK